MFRRVGYPQNPFIGTDQNIITKKEVAEDEEKKRGKKKMMKNRGNERKGGK